MRGMINFMMKLEISIFSFVLVGATIASGKVIYVDDSAIGANDGTNWTDAYNYLQDALADANTAPKPVEIRVAQGIYTPDKGAGITRGDRMAYFQLINGVTVLGGFAGVGAIEPNARYIEAYKTILSGDLSGDDADVENPDELSGHPTRAENSQIVVRCRDNDETAVLDGVTITAGESGMRNRDSNPTVDNCTFLNASYGIFNWDSSQRLTNCTFRGIWLFTIQHNGGSLELINCLFSSNKGGINSLPRTELTLHGCTFIDNVTTSGVINCSLGENLRMYNCVFRNNVSSSISGVRISVEGEFIADNCAFIGNIGRAIEHLGGRMIISNCLIAGNTGGFFSSGINSWDKYVTIHNCTFSGNSSAHDGNALNLLAGGKVSNCIFWANDQPAIDGRERDLFVRYCNVQGGWPGEGNIDVDPCFVSSGYWDLNGTPEDTADDFWVDGDYHLQSQTGHWDRESQAWVQDDVTSPCIDAGDPNSPIGTEPFPNGGRVNMGAYGGGDKASKSYFGKPVCEVIIAGDINGDCVVDFEDLMIIISHWMMRGEDLVNKPPTVRLIEPQDGDRIAWRGPTTFRAEASDVDGHVDRVMFYVQYKRGDYTRTRGFGDSDGSDGWELEFTWPEDADFGEWTAWVEATDNEGVVGISPEITVTLYRP
jgi:parallel beta-helix repeat protein